MHDMKAWSHQTDSGKERKQPPR